MDYVVGESSEMFSLIIESLKSKTEHLLVSKGVTNEDPERQNLLEIFHNFQYPLQQLQTAYQQQKYFAQTGHFVQPWEVPFAIAYYPHNNPDTGHVDKIARHVTLQYIPLKLLLKHILESKGFMRAVLEYQPSNDRIMRDFHDSEFCRGHVFFQIAETLLCFCT